MLSDKQGIHLTQLLPLPLNHLKEFDF